MGRIQSDPSPKETLYESAEWTDPHESTMPETDGPPKSRIHPVSSPSGHNSNLLESILDTMPEFVVYYDEALNVIWANRAAAEFVGMTREEMVGKRFFDVACQRQTPCEGCPVIKGASSESIEIIESNLFVGRLFYTRSYPITCNDQQIPGRLVVAQDISDLRNRYSVTEVLNLISEVFHSPKELPEICEELIKTIVSRFDYPAGYITLYDEKAGELINLGQIDSSGRLIPTGKRLPIARCFSENVIKNGKARSVTGLSKLKDFSGYILKESGAETVVSVPLNVEGNTIGAIVLVDLVERLETEFMIDGLQAVANRLAAEIQRKQVEERLREERNFTTAVLNSAGPIIVILDQEGRIARFNKACERLTGYSQEEAAGRFIWEFLNDPQERDFTRSMFPFTPEKTLPATFENYWVMRNGQKRLISWSNSVMGNVGDQGTHIVAIGIDITDKRRAEEESELRRRQLVEADKMASLGVLASGVAHEVNNPNNFIMMNTPLLRHAWEDISPILEKYYTECGDYTLAGISYSEMREEIPKLLDGIEEGSKRIRHIVMNMKNYAKRDVSDMSQGVVDINDVITAAMGLLSHQIKKSTRSISVDKGENLPRVKGNLQRLEQVVVNLIQNACESLPDRNKGIVIKTYYTPQNDQVVVCVSDQGVGIKPEHMGHLFDPFFTTKSEVGGTGLGLSVCAGIVKEHNGQLEFASEPGKGTKVYFSLPASH